MQKILFNQKSAPLEKQTLREEIRNCDYFFYEPPCLSLEGNFVTYPGQLKLERVFKGKTKIFHIPGTSIVRTKKTFVISDRTFGKKLNNTVNVKAKELIQALIEEDFDVRYWNGSEPIKLKDISLLSEKGIVKAARTEEIKKKLAQENIPGDALLHVDYFELPRLLQNDNLMNVRCYELSPSSYDILFIEDFKEFENMPSDIVSWLKNKKFSISCSYFESLNDEPDQTAFLKLKTLIQHSSEQIVGLELYNFSDIAVFNEIAKVKNLEELVWKEMSWQDLSSILEKDPSKYWRISANEWRTLEVITKFIFPKLRTLILSNTNISSKIVATLIENSLDLVNLDLDGCINLLDISNNLKHSSYMLDKLERIAFSNTQIKADFLATLLKKASALKNLILVNEVMEEGEDDLLTQALNDSYFPQLTHITFHDIKGGSKFLAQMIKKTPHLTYLSIERCTEFSTFQLPRDKNLFPMLQQLWLIGSDERPLEISAVEVAGIINRASKLQTLYLYNWENAESFHADLICSDIRFPISTLSLINNETFCHTPKIPLNTYLKLASQSFIDIIDLRVLSDLEKHDAENVSVPFLPQIKRIVVPNRPHIGEILGQILEKTPNITDITCPATDFLEIFSTTPYIKDYHIPDNLKLPNLKYIYLSELLISGVAIAKILTSSSEIEKLAFIDCYHCDDLTLDFMEGISLPNLDDFVYKSSTLPIATIIKLASMVNNPVINSDKKIPITRTKIDILSVDYLCFQNKLSFTIPEGSCFDSIKKIRIRNNVNADQTFLGELVCATPNVEKIVLNLHESGNQPYKLPTKLRFLKQLSIEMEGKTLPDIIIPLIAAAPNLKHLKLKSKTMGSKVVFDSLMNHPLNMHQSVSATFGELESIAIKYITASDWLYNNILGSKNLKHISLLYVDIPFVITDTISTKRFENIESIEFVNSTIPFDFYVSLLQAGSKLESLYVKSCEQFGDVSNLDFNKLPTFDQLTAIVIIDSDFDIRLLDYIIANAPNLIKLQVKLPKFEYYGIFHEIWHRSQSLPKLLSLSLTDFQLSIDFPERLTLLFPGLMKLNLINCNGLGSKTKVYENSKLKYLEELVIEGGDIEKAKIKQMLLSAPNLKTISLACKNVATLHFHDDEINQLSTALKVFKIVSIAAVSSKPSNVKQNADISYPKNNTSISSNTLHWLIRLNSLETLEFIRCQIWEMPDLQDQLSNLKSLNLNHSIIHYETFISIIDKAQVLEHLDLKNVHFHTFNHYDFNKLNKPSKYLNTFEFNNSNLPLDAVLYICSSSLMKQVIFFGCHVQPIQTTSIPIKLPCVTSLMIHKSAFAKTSLLQLLCAMDNLKKVEFISSPTSGDDTVLSLIPILENLEEIVIKQEDNIANDYLQGALILALLQVSPNVKSIHLKGIRSPNINADDIPDNLILPHLTSITIIDTFLSDDVLQKLKACAPNLATYKAEGVLTPPKNLVNDPILNFKNESTQLKKSKIANLVGKFLPEKKINVASINSGVVPNQVEVPFDREVPLGLKLKAKELFIPNIHPSEYRLDVFPYVDKNGTTISLRQDINKDFKNTNIATYQVPLRETFRKYRISHPSKKLLLCETELVITKEWKRLPSRYPNESMLKFYTDFKKPYEIIYSRSENLYYIRQKGAENKPTFSKINFILEVDVINKKDVIKEKYFANEVQEIVEYCASFTNGEPHFPKNATAQEKIDIRYKSKIGSCENRSIVCHEKLNELFSSSNKFKRYQTRVIRNKIHDFIEIYNGERWYQVDLGGYEVDLEVEKINTKGFDLDLNLEPQEQIVAPLKLITDSTAAKVTTMASQKPILIREITESSLNPKFITWKPKNSTLLKTAEEIFKEISVPGKKSLIMLNNPNDILGVLALFSKMTKKPCLFINSADDLQWCAPGLKFNDAENLVIKKRFSKLRHFLETYPECILFINWCTFNNTDLTALHSVIDTDKQLEGEALPACLPVVSFYSDNLPNAYKGNDFFRRHDVIETWGDELLVDIFHNRVKDLNQSADLGALELNLYESEDWESLLLGSLYLHEKSFILASSTFLGQIKVNPQLSSLHLKNAPWHLIEFQIFWQQALQQGYFILYGKEFKISDDFKISYSSGYDFCTDVIQEEFNLQNENFIYPLNSHTLNEFFTHYEQQNDSFESKEGLLQKHKEITLIVTENMPKQQWCRLLDEAKNKAKFSIRISQDVVLPQEMSHMPFIKFAEEIPFLKISEELYEKPYTIIKCNNTTAIASALCELHQDAKLVSLDFAHDFGDLFYKISSSLTDQGILAHFFESDIWTALQNNETIIIEGTLPLQLINALSPMFISGKAEIRIKGNNVPFNGRLFIVTDNHIPFAKNQFQTDGKLKWLEKIPNNTNEKFSAEQLNGCIEREFKNDRNDLSIEAYENFKTRRFEKIQQGFAKSNIIFYTGPTGIGKSTYLIKEFTNDYFVRTHRRAKLYIGEDEIENFAQHSDEAIDPILFIDEANLSNQKLSILKGMKSKKPHILKNGHYFPIKKQLVFLVGNPKESGGVRQQHEFFDKYTQRVDCDIPNHAYLYHEIVKPQLAKNSQQSSVSKEALNEQETEAIARVILNVFDKANEISATPELMLSPRHLHMMAVLFNTYCDQFKKFKINKIHMAIASCLAIIGDIKIELKNPLLAFLNINYGYDANAFYIAQSKFIEQKIKCLSINTDLRFTFTPSRFPILQILDAFLMMRFQDNFHFGLLLEGDSDNGKSTLLKKYLKLLSIDFVQMSFGKNYESDRKKLLHAFHKGKVVILDELNAGGPKYEKLLNMLIMGTDENGNKAKKPGFMIVSTQNSLELAGRQALPPPIKARFIRLEVNCYPQSELILILTDLGVDRITAQKHVDEFMLSVRYAEQHGLEPKPSLSHLLSGADVLELTKEHTINTSKIKKLTDNQNHSVEIEPCIILPDEEKPPLSSNLKQDTALPSLTFFPKEKPVISFPVSYRKLTEATRQRLRQDDDNNPELQYEAALTLLADYSKMMSVRTPSLFSSFLLFCTLHWNRHHTNVVRELIKERRTSHFVESNQDKLNVRSLLEDLQERLNINNETLKISGSLATRINFIQAMTDEEIFEMHTPEKNYFGNDPNIR